MLFSRVSAQRQVATVDAKREYDGDAWSKGIHFERTASIVTCQPGEVDKDALERAPGILRTGIGMVVRRSRLLGLVEESLDALVLVISLWSVALIVNGHILPRDILLALLLFSLAFPGTENLTDTIPDLARHIVAGCGRGIRAPLGVRVLDRLSEIFRA